MAAGALQSIDERMALLVDTVQRLSLARSLQDIQEVVRVCARSLTGADGATFVLREGDQCFYADEDITLLRALADSTAVALENVSVLEQLDYQVRLLNTLAHEVRNPLLAAQALIDQVDRDEALELASDALTEAMRIVGEQLDVAKMNASEPRVMLEDVELAPLLEGLRNSYAPLCHRGVELVADVPAALAVRTDPRVLSQIVRNLLSNALKFTDRGTVAVTAAAGDGGIEVAVSDTGLGIAAEDQPRIFEAFEQVDGVQAGRRPGTGLGLPLVRKLARALGGDVELQSQPGQGSRFTVVLPA